MTDKHDKLVEMALASGAQYHVTTDPGVWLELDAEALAAFAAAHVASLCADVEPVAFMFQHSETGRIAFVDAWQKENGWATANPRYKEVGALHGASTVAALKAEIEALRKDAERYRWLRDGEIVADYPYPVMRMGGSRVDDQTIWADELDAAIDDAISAAQHPQQEQSK